jgi:prepilin peptidase CpaA
MTPELFKTLLPLAFAGLVIVAAMTDLATFTIPNWISVVLALAFAPFALLAGASIGAVAQNLGVGVAVFVLAAGMFAFGWIGGGDAKLMAAASLWVGLKGLPAFAVFTGLAGGGLVLVLLAMRSAWIRPIAAAGPSWTQRLATPGESAPYGVAIAIGALAAFVVHPLI